MIHSNPIWLRNRFEKISFLLRSQCAHTPTSTRINCERRRQSKRSVAALYKLPKRIIVMVLTVRHRFWYSISNVKRQSYVYLQPNAFKLHQKHNFQFDWDFVCANNCICTSFVHSSLTHHYMRFILTLHTSCLLSNVKSNRHPSWFCMMQIASYFAGTRMVQTTKIGFSNWLVTHSRKQSATCKCICISIDVLLCICHARKWNDSAANLSTKWFLLPLPMVEFEHRDSLHESTHKQSVVLRTAILRIHCSTQQHQSRVSWQYFVRIVFSRNKIHVPFEGWVF